MRLHHLITLALCTLHFAACGGEESGTNTTPPTDAPRTGKTDCGSFGDEAISCNPGFYCADQVLTRCEEGCIGDMNCPADQACAKPSGQNTGICQTTVTPNPNPNPNPDPNPNPNPNPNPDPDPDPNPNPNPTSCTVTLTAQDGCAADRICLPGANDRGVCMSFEPCDAQQQCAPGLSGAICSTRIIADKSPMCLPELCLIDADCPQANFCVKLASELAGFCNDGRFGADCLSDAQCVEGLACDMPFPGEPGTCFDL